MDEQTALILALQFLALFGIAGALIAYLLCKIQTNSGRITRTIPTTIPINNYGDGRAVLITSADTAIGLQITIHLATRGFRVFAGLKDDTTSISARMIGEWLKNRENFDLNSNQNHCNGAIITLPLDITREDLLHESIDKIRAHLPAGEDTIWAIINTDGICYRGRLQQQNLQQWEQMFKINVLGVLRTVRAYHNLLKNGRFFNFGYWCDDKHDNSGLVAYTASRYAIDGINQILRNEFSVDNIKIITMKLCGLPPESLFIHPKLTTEKSETVVNISDSIGDYYPLILKDEMFEILDTAILCRNPKFCYNLNYNPTTTTKTTKSWWLLKQFKM